MIDSRRGKAQQLLRMLRTAACIQSGEGGTEGAADSALSSQCRDPSGMSGRKLKKLACWMSQK